MILYKLAVFTFAITQTTNIAAFNILAIVSMPLKSHYMAFQNLFRELALRGHSVTVINNYPEQDSPKNLTFINIEASRVSSFPLLSDLDNFDFTYAHLYNFNMHFVLGVDNVRQDCEYIFTSNNMKEFRRKGEKFDVIFVEQFMSDCGLVYAAAMYEAPIIGITSHTMLPWAYSRLGLPFNIGSDAFYFCKAGSNPGVYQKIENFIMNLYMETGGKWKVQRGIYDTFNQYLPNVILDVDKIAKERMKMMFSYQHHSVTGARLLAPQVLEIGGIHIRKSKPVPEAIEKFISTAEHGVVFISFGSNLKLSTMSEYKIKQFLLAFKKIPQKVLWKLENMTLPSGNENVLTQEWFPQLDVLCHPKVLAFISHGGMLSLSEAAHCGTPLLAVPFFGDQFSNSAAIVDSGLGATMFFNQINAESLTEMIKHLTSKKMQESAQRVSKLWHDRPMNVMDSAIYWTEYVARHGNAPPSLPSTRLSWYQSSLLDVYAILTGIILILVVVVYYICKLVILFLSNLLRSFIIKEPGEKKKRM